MKNRFQEALRRIDEENRKDPHTEKDGDTPTPREFLFAKRVYDWIPRLVADPSEALLLAARAHTLRRWDIPRDRYPRNISGYHEWRQALADHHAAQARRILSEVGYPEETITRVETLITKRCGLQDPEAAALEDADCLVFLETKLARYLDAWEEETLDRVLRGTLAKMTPEGRRHISTLSLGARERDVLSPFLKE